MQYLYKALQGKYTPKNRVTRQDGVGIIFNASQYNHSRVCLGPFPFRIVLPGFKCIE